MSETLCPGCRYPESYCKCAEKKVVVKRPTADQGWMLVAEAVAQRGTCLRRKVGAVVVVDGQIVATGYNGAPRGEPHCLDVGCEVEHGHCIRTVHAELNALLQAGRTGHALKGATLYTTASPCRRCMQAILNAGLGRVVFAEPYRSADHLRDAAAWALEAGARAGVDMLLLKQPHRY